MTRIKLNFSPVYCKTEGGFDSHTVYACEEFFFPAANSRYLHRKSRSLKQIIDDNKSGLLTVLLFYFFFFIH